MSIGVYAIVNEEIGQIIYIGCSKIFEERQRIFQRELKRNVCPQPTVQKIYNQIGLKGISFELLEETSLEERFQAEKRWIQLYQPIDNIWHTPKNEAVNKSRSEKLKGTVHSPESIELTAKKLRGQKLSQQARENMSKAHKGKPWSDARRAVGNPKRKKS